MTTFNFTLSRRTVLSGMGAACIVCPSEPTLAEPGNTYKHRVPPGIGISRYTVRRDRAQRSFVTLSYYDYFASRWVIDNVQDPIEQKNIDVDYALVRPAAFQAGSRPLLINISATWMPDNSNNLPMERVDYAQFPDRVEVYFFCHAGDPNGTAIAKLFYTHDIPIP